MRPPFEVRVIEETEDRRTIMDGSGTTYIQPKDGHSTIPHYLDFPIKTRDDWQRFEERLDPADPGRLPTNLPEIKAEWERRDVPVGTSIGSLFAWLPNWMGFEGISIACAEDGPTYKEALANVETIAQEWIETAKELGRPVPEPKGRLVFA